MLIGRSHQFQIELRYQDGTPVEAEWFRGRPVAQYLRVGIFVPSLASQPKLQSPRILPMAATRWEVNIDVTPNWSNSSRPIFLEVSPYSTFVSFTLFGRSLSRMFHFGE